MPHHIVWSQCATCLRETEVLGEGSRLRRQTCLGVTLMLSGPSQGRGGRRHSQWGSPGARRPREGAGWHGGAVTQGSEVCIFFQKLWTIFEQKKDLICHRDCPAGVGMEWLQAALGTV